MKNFATAALAAGLMSFAVSAFAQDAMKTEPMAGDAMAAHTMCDDASMMKLKAEVEATGDAMMKEAAGKEMMIADEAMKDNDSEKCVMHMDAAMKSAKGMYRSERVAARCRPLIF